MSSGSLVSSFGTGSKRRSAPPGEATGDPEMKRDR
jgi:hypothetical protein